MFRALPVTALRTFESSARHLSFKSAADELAVTPAAVSHQVRSLEEWLGVALFERLPRGVKLTAKGEQLFQSLHSALLEMAQATSSVRILPSTGKLTVTVPPSFAAFWLIPRLDRFYARHPDIQLRLDTSADTVDLQQDASIDVAIRYGDAAHAGLHVEARMAETFSVYGAPALIDADASAVPPALITVAWRDAAVYHAAWQAWCDKAGVDWLRSGVTWRSYAEELYAFQAAIAGQGLVLASSIMVGETARIGLLKEWRPGFSVAGGSYAALCVPGRERHPPVRAFFAWLAEEWAGAQESGNQAFGAQSGEQVEK